MLTELWSDLRFRIRALLRRGAVERELTDELQFHLERETEKYLRAGLSPEEARRRALVLFGGVERVKEESRDARGLRWLEAMRQDLRYAFRNLRASPGVTAAVVLTLSLGIGANTAMFGIIDQLLFRAPAFLRRPSEVNRVYLAWTGRNGDRAESSFEYTRYLDFVRWSSSTSALAAFHSSTLVIGTGVEAREMPIAAVSANLFSLFDVAPTIGRFFTPEEDQVPRGAPVAVLGYAFWQTQFGGRADAIGQALPIGPDTYTIIGVAPRNFVGMSEREAPAAFVPITTFGASASEDFGGATDYYTNYHWGWLEVAARRKPGVSVAAATTDLTGAYLRSYEAERALSPTTTPATIAHPHVILGSVLSEGGPNQGTVTKVAKWLSGVALIVLVIACANVANLLLARALRRRREIALRLALGVGRARLAAQLLTESLLLALFGGAAALAVAHWGGSVLRALFLPKSAAAPPFDGRLLLFTASAAILAGLVTGVAPVLHARRADLAGALKAGAREGTRERSRMRGALLLLQGALSVVLLIGAGLFLKSLDRVRSMRLGYDVEPLIYVSTNLRGLKLEQPQKVALIQRLHQAAKTIPGVTEATEASTIPFWLSWSTSLYIPGIDSVERLGHFALQAGSPEYFRTMGTRLLRGRGISEQDRKGATGAMIVSEAMASVLWPGKDPIGQCVKVEADSLPCSTVVGVAENIKRMSLTDDPGFQYYLSIEQFHPESAGLFVRVDGRGVDLVETVRRELQKLMPASAYVSATPMEEITGPQFRSWRLGATMFLAFGALALVLAAVGLYSVIAYSVTQRTHEMGLRIALGAGRPNVLRLVVGEGVRFAVTGVIVGAVIALAGGRWLAPLLFEVSARDPLVFGAVTLVLLGVAVLASALPARRATRVDPSVALRAD